MPDIPYSKRELDEKFNDMMKFGNSVMQELSEIKDQLKLTNGSVKNLQLWKAWITGALAVICTIVLPISGYLAYQVIHPPEMSGNLSASITQVESSIEQLQAAQASQNQK